MKYNNISVKNFKIIKGIVFNLRNKESKMAKFIKVKFPQLLLLLISFILFCFITACGNSESTTTDTGTNTTTSSGSITLSMTKVSDGTYTDTVSTDSPTHLTATAVDGNGAPIVQKMVTFTPTTSGMVTFSPATTALTNASGIASVTLNAGSTPGATEISAAITTTGGITLTNAIDIAVATTSSSLSLSDLTITPTTLSAGGSAAVSLTVKHGLATYMPSVPIDFTSYCTQSVPAKATISTTVYTINGIASATYRDINCGAIDTITATLRGTSTTKQGTINVTPATAGSISFISATPNNISLPGSGGTTQSIVLFRVLDTTGNPIQKQVNFSLDTTVGGITISTASAMSDPSTGNVQTIVYAGSVSTPVRVAAQINETTLTSTSDKLTISTGIPSQKAFSLAASTLNTEGLDYNDVTSVITARLADRFLNPVPDGTVVNFTASGGAVEASCQTGVPTTAYPNPLPGTCGVYFISGPPKPSNGRVVVLAYALGEESFIDTIPTNGRFDLTETFTDIPEPFLDANENGTWSTSERFIDTNANGSYSAGDGVFNGVLRDASITGPAQIHVRNSTRIILAGSTAEFSSSPDPITLAHCTDGVAFTNTPVIANVSVHDKNGNIMPKGTTISFTTTNGTISGTSSFTVENAAPASGAETTAATTYKITMRSDATQGEAPGYKCTNPSANGSLYVTVKSPFGVTSYGDISVTD